MSALGRAMRIDELRGQIIILEGLRIQAYAGGSAEREIDAVIAAKEAEIAALEQASDGKGEK